MDALHGSWLNVWRKSLTAITQECCELYWTSPRGKTVAVWPPTTYYENYQLDEPDMRDCWRSKDELTSDILRWIPSHGRAKEVRSARTYIQQLCRLDDLLGTMDNRDGWREKVVLAVRHDEDGDDMMKMVMTVGERRSCWQRNMMKMVMTSMRKS